MARANGQPASASSTVEQIAEWARWFHGAEGRRALWLRTTGLLPPEERGWLGPPDDGEPTVPRVKPDPEMRWATAVASAARRAAASLPPADDDGTRGIRRPPVGAGSSRWYWGDVGNSWDNAVRAMEDA